jgi:V8-like Glu-specific endopeptidase
MKKLKLVALFLLLASCSAPKNPMDLSKTSTSDVVYGEDNRAGTDINEILDQNPFLTSEQAQMLLDSEKATAGMVELDRHVQRNGDGTYEPIKDLATLKERRNLCGTERFADEYTLPICTGFLIGPDLLATAGHCVDRENYAQRAWIFGYDSTYSFNQRPVFSKDQVYLTKEVVYWDRDVTQRKDYAVVRLDRPVTDIQPLKFRSSGLVPNNTDLAIIGHPTGLTSKIAAGGKVLNNSFVNAIKTNVDSFAGNSGSPVLNIQTGMVEGILVSGAEDYLESTRTGENCVVVNKRPMEAGEEYITNIVLIAKKLAETGPSKPVVTGPDPSGPGDGETNGGVTGGDDEKPVPIRGSHRHPILDRIRERIRRGRQPASVFSVLPL